jgi:2'-5' RNA ligase
VGNDIKTRCFVAIEVPKKFDSSLIELEQKFEGVCKKTNVNTFHITLLFLGEISNVDDIIQKLREISFDKFDSNLSGMHYFEHNGNITVGSVGIESKELRELQQKIVEKLHAKEERSYVPHLTLFRVKEVFNDKAFKDAVSSINYKETFHVDEFLLFSSTITSAGPIYTVLERFKLK